MSIFLFSETYNSASDILKQTEVKISSRVKTALEKITKESSEVPIPDTTPTFLKRVSSELIERVCLIEYLSLKIIINFRYVRRKQ